MASVSTESATSAALPIEVSAMVKRFGAVTAVDGVSMNLRAGECLGLLGPNGAGKSTVIRAIAGRVIPDAGRIAILGFAAGSPGAREALGWVPQELAIYPRLTCRENLLSFGRYYGLSGSRLREQVAWCLRWASIEDRARDRAGHLSGGMKRRLNMAAGIIHRPRVVLMDEPTVGVDPQSRNRIFDMIAALRDQGAAIIYTTHYMEEAERLCDRIAIIDHGHIIAEGTHTALVQSAFGTRSQVVVRFAGPAPESSPTPSPEIAAWVERQGGRLADSTAQFTVERSTDIAGLLEDAARQGIELDDVSLRRPNLESVFLHLTGRELRD